MRFLLDESADYPLRAFLADKGHNVTAIAHDYPRALGDDEVLGIAYRERRILLTNDRDFGELIFRRRLDHAGVILFRLASEAIPVKEAWLDYVLTHHVEDLKHFVVITDRGIRVRRT